MKIQHISDTHGHHLDVEIDYDCNILIHSGDESNSFDLINNQKEFDSFYEWWADIPIVNKILIAGNHSTALTKQYNKDKIRECCVYLEHDYATVEGLTIFGSPYTPTYGGWNFMKSPTTIGRIWEHLENIDILITHGPPKGILDLAYHGRYIEHCGDSALLKKILKITPKLHCFGHIHDNYDNINNGLLKHQNIVFSNGVMVKDGEMKKLKYTKGNIINVR